MEHTVCSVKKKEVLTPKNIIRWHHDSDVYMYLESSGPLELKIRNKAFFLQKGQSVIGSRFQIANPTNEAVVFRAIALRGSPEWNGRPIIQPYIFDSNETTRLIGQAIDGLKIHPVCNKSLWSIFHLIESLILNMEALSCDEKVPLEIKKSTDKIDSRLLMINRFIRKNYHQQISLLYLSELICCNPVYLSNTFSKVFHVSPIKYLQQIRMEKAKEMIASTDEAISEIAGKMGYVSNSQFSELFKRTYGVSPTQYRSLEHIHANFGRTKEFKK
ncbi:helix-turn-helix domain-containing protein [Paenibacillus glucanolyticus]|uniref:helix-turn-helix domain-containing protein n=1 Tax=Paenibacillus glucanolyticus TaxID=59843 RepID=UPI00369654A8